MDRTTWKTRSISHPRYKPKVNEQQLTNQHSAFSATCCTDRAGCYSDLGCTTCCTTQPTAHERRATKVPQQGCATKVYVCHQGYGLRLRVDLPCCVFGSLLLHFLLVAACGGFCWLPISYVQCTQSTSYRIISHGTKVWREESNHRWNTIWNAVAMNRRLVTVIHTAAKKHHRQFTHLCILLWTSFTAQQGVSQKYRCRIHWLIELWLHVPLDTK